MLGRDRYAPKTLDRIALREVLSGVGHLSIGAVLTLAALLLASLGVVATVSRAPLEEQLAVVQDRLEAAESRNESLERILFDLQAADTSSGP